MAIPAKFRIVLAAFLCGAVMPLGFAPYGLYFVPILALAAFALLLFPLRPGEALLAGWCFGLGQFGVGVSWVYISIYLYGNAGLPLSLAVMLLLVAFLALYPALMAGLLAKARAGSAAMFYIGLFPAAWVLSEWLRSWLLTGFPWLNLGYSQIDSLLASVAPVFGVYGVSWVTALFAGLIAALLRAPGWPRLTTIPAMALIAVISWGLNQLDWTDLGTDTLRVTLVQGNIPQDMKWKPEQQAATLETYVDLTRAHYDSDLIIWPETAIPAFYDEVLDSFIKPLSEQLRANHVSLITGIPVLDRKDWKYYNAVISLDEPDRFYYKVHLVPFGEYLPLRHWLAGILGFLPVPEADFSAGSPDQRPLRAAGVPIGVSICYEIAFGEQLIKALPEASLLVNVSNDAWFGDSLAPHQHLEMARMRAREVERYVLRATNTGISAIIAPDGTLKARSRQFETETISAEVEPRHGATPYVRWGNWPVVSGALFVLGVLLWRIRAKARFHQSEK
ncbi:Apolipoprotein N-acyltransferase / Copper homeostasis protein CutE [hydrothermal vent metagenome]|uniref:Apolipoprotein N-acyltransferase / Copper homeostasis protein CutE n=1 Tax=hydrothermal vent metagenome TaxID=652676 RepID=A0A3B0Z5I4_9ZZZZ